MQLIGLENIAALFPELSNVEPLSEGGQKIVLKCRKMEQALVLKLIRNPEESERTSREILVSTSYDFSNVPKIIDYGIKAFNGENILYIVEEFINGESLCQKLNRERQLSLKESVKLLNTLLVFASEAEGKFLVHRDIKPENIMIDENQKYWIIDFGIARHLDKASLTISNARFGPHTPGYAAPEQFRNIKKDIDARSDLFSIGVVLYEAITGHQPFREGARDPITVLHNTQTLNVPPFNIPGDNQRQLCSFILMLMEKFPSRRPQNAKTALAWFNAILPTISL
jgi:serine/threonine-protein kinase